MKTTEFLVIVSSNKAIYYLSSGDFTWTYRCVYQPAIQFYDQVCVEL